MADLANLVFVEVDAALDAMDPALKAFLNRVIGDFEKRIKAESDTADEIACELGRCREALVAATTLAAFREAGADDHDIASNLKRATQLNDRLQAENLRLSAELDAMALRNASPSIETDRDGIETDRDTIATRDDADELEERFVEEFGAQVQVVVAEAMSLDEERAARKSGELGFDHISEAVAASLLRRHREGWIPARNATASNGLLNTAGVRKFLRSKGIDVPDPDPAASAAGQRGGERAAQTKSAPPPVVVTPTVPAVAPESKSDGYEQPWKEPEHLDPAIRTAVGSIQGSMRKGVPIR